MALVDRWRSLSEEVRYFVVGIVSATVVTYGPAIYESVFGELRSSTQIILGGIVAVAGISLWSTRRISSIENQLEHYFSLLILSQLHLIRTVDNTDEDGDRTATDGGTQRGDHTMNGTETRGGIDAGASMAGALVASATFAAIALGVFGEFVGTDPSATLVIIAGVGGVFGAYGGDRLVRRKRTTGSSSAGRHGYVEDTTHELLVAEMLTANLEVLENRDDIDDLDEEDLTELINLVKEEARTAHEQDS